MISVYIHVYVFFLPFFFLKVHNLQLEAEIYLEKPRNERFCNVLVGNSFIVATGCPSERRPHRRRLVVTGDSARIQDETTESSAWFINPFPDMPWFLRVYSTSLLKTL